MKIIGKEEFFAEKIFYLNEMKKGKIFIYPTDTIYGIGCDAVNEFGILKIRGIKRREEKPFSVIAPSKKWIGKNCFVNSVVDKWINKLPGPYTLILELKNLGAVSNKVNNGMDSLGIRIPSHWFSEIVSEFNKPFVTTSVNLSGEPYMKKFDELDDEIKKGVDYVIYEGILQGKPSTIIKLTRGMEEAVDRWRKVY